MRVAGTSIVCSSARPGFAVFAEHDDSTHDGLILPHVQGHGAWGKGQGTTGMRELV